MADLARDIVRSLRDGEAAIAADKREKVKAAIRRMKELFGYDETMTRDAASALVRWRFADLVV